MNKACPVCESWFTFTVEDKDLGTIILCRRPSCKQWSLYPDEV